MKQRFTNRRLIGLIAGLLCTGMVNAASLSVFLDQSERFPLLPDGTNYLQVTVSDGIDGAIDFRVETLAPLQSLAGYNFGIQAFAFNLGGSGAGLGNLVLPDSWNAFSNENFSGFGDFDVVIKRGGVDRLDPLVFSIQGVAGDSIQDYLASLSTGFAPEGNVLFSALVVGFDGDRVGAKFGGNTVVPIPAALWLMISGLGLLGCFRRRQVAVQG